MPWPLVPVSNDPDADEVLTPAKLLTYKPQHLKPPAGKFSAENLSQTMETRPTPCRCFLVAMEEREYLLTLQPHRKWQNMTRNVQKSDLVLLCCKDAPRNDWPLARVTRAQADSDGMVQGVDLVTVRGGSKRHFKQPITETILLKSENQWI